jgi:galactose mutarotase-like enzyme
MKEDKGMAEIFRTAADGIPAVGLRSAQVEVVILPSLGAKVAHLRDLNSGREWMWRPPEGAIYRQLPVGTDFRESSRVGADECFPTIGPCTWRGRELPDHGEVWAIPWMLDPEGLEAGRITTEVRLPVSPFVLTRTVTLDERRLSFAYRLQNLDGEEQEFMWAFHPLLCIEEGDMIDLPSECSHVRVYGQEETRFAWPSPREGVHWDQLELGSGSGAIKLFTEPLQRGFVEVRNTRTRDRLRYEFDPREVDTVGLWITRGGWNGYHHFAVEPGIGAPDPLDAAVEQWQRYGVVAAHGERQWGFTLIVG